MWLALDPALPSVQIGHSKYLVTGSDHVSKMGSIMESMEAAQRETINIKSEDAQEELTSSTPSTTGIDTDLPTPEIGQARKKKGGRKPVG